MNVGRDVLPGRPGVLDRPAISLEDEPPLTYRELTSLRDDWAAALLASGVQRGGRVAVMLRNCVDYWAIHLAIAWIGAVTVRVNFRLSADELRFVLHDCGATAVVVHASLVGVVAEARRTGTPLSAVLVITDDSAEGNPPLPDWAASVRDVIAAAAGTKQSPPGDTADDPHMIMYTSGTTGRPKGAVWTHRSTIMFGVMQILQWGGSPERVAMTTGPLYHVGSMEDVLLPTLMLGGHAVISRSGNFSIQRALQVMAKLRVTDVLLFPAMIYEMLNLDDLATYDLSAVRAVLTGGSPLLDWAVERFHDALPAARLYPVYGLTEGGGISVVLDADEVRQYPTAAGRPLPLADTRVDAPVGEVGEICVRGPNTAVAYWNRDDESKEVFADGWVRTGDLGRIDESGRLFVTDRKKDMIRTGDENVYAAEVERVLAEHGAILEASVFGVPDPKYGEAVAAAVVLRQGRSLTEAEVIDHCRARLASYKKPQFVTFMAELPRNLTGKVVKATLRERFKDVRTLPAHAEAHPEPSDG